MKLLIQHRHYDNEISGVLTYIRNITPELLAKNVEVKTVSTRQDDVRKWLRSVIWADVVHMNSNDLGFALLCKVLMKKIVIKYHYPFYHSTHSCFREMTFWQRLKTELKYTLPKANYPLKWKLHTLVKWARLATRILTSLLANYHTACSDFLGKSTAFPWLIRTLYNPMKIQLADKSKNIKDLSKPYKFIFLGRLNQDKGVDILLQAVKILHQENLQFQVLIIGDGPQADEYRQMAVDLGILDVVCFLGKLPHQQALEKVYDALALVVPSRWQDPAPYVVLEASSVQTCAIVAKMGGLPEVAGPHSWFFDNEDIQGLANCMRDCLVYPDETVKRGFLSSKYVADKFSPDSAALDLLEICSLR